MCCSGLFVYFRPVKLKPDKLVALFILGAAILLVGVFQFLAGLGQPLALFERLEWITYDWRVREAARHPETNASNLGFVFISDDSIKALLDGSLDYKVGLYWPRHVYGRLAEELSAQGAKAVAFDILFAELRPDHAPVMRPTGFEQDSDSFFAERLRNAGNVILAAEKGVLPPPLFRTNAWALGDIAARRESDGILRRTRAFEDYYLWHRLINQAAPVLGLDLRQARAESNHIFFPTLDRKGRIMRLDQSGNFDQVKLYEELMAPQKAPAGVQAMQKPFTRLRVWDVGIALAARELQLDLDHALIEPRRIVLRGAGGIERVIPIDEEGRFYIDWGVPPLDPRLTKESIESLLLQERDRRLGNTAGLTNRFQNKLVVVGSIASGNDLTDLGATPLERETYLTSRCWNTANSVITGRFVQQPGLPSALLLVLLLGLAGGPLTWNLRPLFAALSVVIVATVYVVIGLQFYVHSRYWLPLVLPLMSLFLTHFSLITYEAFFEQNERRRIKGVFAKIVSPNVVNELLKAKKLSSLVGARRRVSVFFADVRGFTEMTDVSHAKAEEYVVEHKLGDAAAEAYFDQQSQEVLQTVNLYLGLIADTVKQHDGTLDKYIGDCVMAFWGAPTPNEKHAAACVRAAIEAQRAIYALNVARAAENKRREQENIERTARQQPPLPLLKLLSLGTGINTGVVTVGLMGSDAHIVNYTVFGREVNLASRLEGFSGRGRIIVGEATYLEVLRDDPALAAAFVAMPPSQFKGFKDALKIYEVPWKPEKATATAAAEKTAVTT